jgi:hypothetical protein
MGSLHTRKLLFQACLTNMAAGLRGTGIPPKLTRSPNVGKETFFQLLSPNFETGRNPGLAKKGKKPPLFFSEKKFRGENSPFFGGFFQKPPPSKKDPPQ